ncbi:MAG: hypothetical protein JNM17_21785 [Archangium sp.]|nr:hypothetical protein [Archangium sp.]
MKLRAKWLWMLIIAASPAFADDRPDAGSFDETVTLLQKHFWKELSREEIEHEAIKALLEKIDPYGKFLDVKARQAFEGYLAATTTGIGVDLFIDDTVHLPRVRHLLLGGGAGAAGVRAGDWIVSIDGRTCEGQSMDEVLPRLRGAPGSSVSISVRRQASSKPLSLTVVRKTFSIPSVHGVRRDAVGRPVYVLPGEPKLGYVRIDHLADDSFELVDQALAELKRDKARGLVLDLRDSAGGLMKVGVRIADLFLGEGVIAGEETRQGRSTTEADAKVSWAGAVVLLINGNTASASEFLAEALHDRGRARALGQKSFGKGLVQVKYGLSDGSAVIFSTGRQVRPGPEGRGTVAADRNDPAPRKDQAGVTPDPGLEVVVDEKEHERWLEDVDLRSLPAPMTDAEISGLARDRVLERAVQVLTEELAPTRDGGRK